jgi:predicted nucleic acid-binding protein
MRVLLDTNVLIRLGFAPDAVQDEAKAAVAWLFTQGHVCVVVPQILYEFWVVMTRPAEQNGMGMSVQDADGAIADLSTRCRLLLDERGVYSHWRSLVLAHAVKGKSAHDARIAAAMHRHGLQYVVTFNKADFQRFPGIDAFTPAEVVAGELTG